MKLNAAEAVARGLRLRGRLPLAALPRLVESLTSSEGELLAELEFSADPLSQGRLQGRLRATVVLTCQRCLQPLPWSLDLKPDLSLVASEEDEERLLESREPVRLEAGQLLLREALEDELLLGLPLAPTCADPACAQRVQSPGETIEPQLGDNVRPGDSRPNPFLALKGKFPAR
ncbi:MAG: YceD family protein [Stagnimonas sp.]|nr:YceD family protein [Stagnimonas sp.]